MEVTLTALFHEAGRFVRLAARFGGAAEAQCAFPAQSRRVIGGEAPVGDLRRGGVLESDDGGDEPGGVE
jgi:hypothetical protein